MEQMTEYERKRLENVQRNRQMLAALRVHDTAESLRSATKKPKWETKAYKPPKREGEPEPSVLRRSLRTRGLSPQRNGPPAAPREGFTPPSSFSSKPPTSLRKGPLHLAETYASYGEEDTYDHYFNRLRELRDSEGRGLAGPKVSPEDLKLEAKDIATLAPNKILSVHILPCRERVIVVGGDREGYLSLWDADCEEEGKGFHMYLPHSAAVSGIATAPCSVEKVQFLPCYNGNVGLSNGLDSWNTTMIYDSNPLRTRIPFFRAVIWGLDCRTIWGWDDNYFFIGNMERALDAICTSTKITTTLRSPLIRAIPSRLAKHPFSHGILAGAIGSGQVCVWRKH